MAAAHDLKNWITHVQSPRVEKWLKDAAKSDTISLAGGLPSEELFPTEDLSEALQKVIAEHAIEALQYSWPEGYQTLRDQIAQRITARGMPAEPNEILITHGAQQALDLVAKLLVRAGDRIALESPTYAPAIQAFDMYRPVFVPLQRTREGLDIQQVEDVLKHERPKLIYLIATGHNPTGLSLPHQSRTKLADILAALDAYVIEEDAYGELQYDHPQKPINAILKSPRHIFVSSFSKILSPGLRLGWIAAPESLIKELTLIKQAADLQSASLNQLVLSTYLSNASLDEQVKHCITFYRERRDCMVECAARYFPPEVQWSRPDSAFSLWVQLPAHVDADSLLNDAIKDAQVAFEPGNPYFPVNASPHFIRLSFSSNDCSTLRTGMDRLGKILADRVT